MKFQIRILKQAKKEFSKLTKEQQDAVTADYDIVKNKGIEFVKRRFLQDQLFEIKTNDIRSLFKYAEEKIIVVSLIYEKRTQKAPNQLIKLAIKRLKEEGL